MFQSLFDPKAFNVLIMFLYGLAAVRWAAAGKYADCLYWLFALGLTAVITYGYKR